MMEVVFMHLKRNHLQNFPSIFYAAGNSCREREDYVVHSETVSS